MTTFVPAIYTHDTVYALAAYNSEKEQDPSSRIRLIRNKDYPNELIATHVSKLQIIWDNFLCACKWRTERKYYTSCFAQIIQNKSVAFATDNRHRLLMQARRGLEKLSLALNNGKHDNERSSLKFAIQAISATPPIPFQTTLRAKSSLKHVRGDDSPKCERRGHFGTNIVFPVEERKNPKKLIVPGPIVPIQPKKPISPTISDFCNSIQQRGVRNSSTYATMVHTIEQLTNELELFKKKNSSTKETTSHKQIVTAYETTITRLENKRNQASRKASQYGQSRVEQG